MVRIVVMRLISLQSKHKQYIREHSCIRVRAILHTIPVIIAALPMFMEYLVAAVSNKGQIYFIWTNDSQSGILVDIRTSTQRIVFPSRKRIYTRDPEMCKVQPKSTIHSRFFALLDGSRRLRQRCDSCSKKLKARLLESKITFVCQDTKFRQSMLRKACWTWTP